VRCLHVDMNKLCNQPVMVTMFGRACQVNMACDGEDNTTSKDSN
jgi:hypothetical protein